MKLVKEIRWPLLLVTALGMMVFLMLADVVFVTYYAQLGNPGQPQEFYNEFAMQTAGAFVFCLAPFPAYLLTRWLCAKTGQHFFAYAVLLVAAFYGFDVIMIAAMGAWEGLASPQYWLNTAAMLAGAMAGAHFAGHAERRVAVAASA